MCASRRPNPERPATCRPSRWADQSATTFRVSRPGDSWATDGSGAHPLWGYVAIMAKTIQVRDVPDDVHQRLVLRARAERRSLSELVRAEIVEMARRPTMAEMLDRLAGRSTAKLPESAADALAGERLGS